MKWFIGCSGFYYREWKNTFYPAGLVQKNWFTYYCSQFDSIELNGTFYRLPKVENLQKWHDTSPAGFTFSVKAPRLITHYKKFVDCEAALNEFHTTIRQGLHDKIATVLFQFPPSFTYNRERLDLILQNLDHTFKNVLEFRHLSWWCDEVYKRLEKEKVIFSGMSHPKLPGEAIITGSIAYYRFHGTPRLYYSVYEPAFLQHVADQLLLNKGLKEVYIYFNNTAALGAIENAQWLKAYTTGKKHSEK